jgi:hypothetical protein
MSARKAQPPELDIVLYPPTPVIFPPNDPNPVVDPLPYKWTPQFNCCGCSMMIVVALFLLWFFRGCG